MSTKLRKGIMAVVLNTSATMLVGMAVELKIKTKEVSTVAEQELVTLLSCERLNWGRRGNPADAHV